MAVATIVLHTPLTKSKNPATVPGTFRVREWRDVPLIHFFPCLLLAFIMIIIPSNYAIWVGTRKRRHIVYWGLQAATAVALVSRRGRSTWEILSLVRINQFWRRKGVFIRRTLPRSFVSVPQRIPAGGAGFQDPKFGPEAVPATWWREFSDFSSFGRGGRGSKS